MTFRPPVFPAPRTWLRAVALALSVALAPCAAMADEPGFDGVAALLDDLSAHPSAANRDRIAAMVAPGGTLAGTDAAPLLAAALDVGGALEPGDRLAMGRRWLAGHPHDAAAWRFVGRRLMELERPDEAAQALAQAETLAPSSSSAVELAAALIRLGRMDEARKAAESGQPDRRAALRAVVRALVAAGELARARLALDGGLQEWPQDADLLADKGLLELAAGRPVRAIAPLQRALAGAGTPLAAPDAARVALVRAWSAAGKPVRAFQAFTDLRPKGQPVNPIWLAAALDAAAAYGDHHAVDSLAEEYLDRVPDSPDILRRRAAAVAALGARMRAAEMWRRALRQAPPDEAGVAALSALSAEPEADLAALRRDMPWFPAVWHTAAAPEPDVPHLAWPVLDKAARLEKAGDRAGALAALEAGLAAIPPLLEGQRALLLRQRARLEEPGPALADLEAAQRLGLPRGEAAGARAALLLELGRPQDAAAEAWTAALARPDDLKTLEPLFQPAIAEVLGAPRLFGHLHDVVARNPFDLSRRLEGLRRHAGPGGSPLLALAHALALDRGAPDDPRVAEGRALRDEVVGRLQALGRIEDIDVAAGRLVLERRDGVRVAVAVHPVTGRLLRYAEGPAWTAARWDDAGVRLLEMTDGAGNTLTLTWDAGRLAAMTQSGLASFHADFRPDGALERVEGPQGAAEATAAYNRAVLVVGRWVRGDLDAVPELPGDDPDLQRLLAAERQGGDRARLATAAWLAGHAAAGRTHAGEALRRLDTVLDRAMASTAAKAEGLEAVRVWHDLALTLWPDGLNTSAWARWSAISRWAARAAPRSNLLADVEARPLQLAASARWLAGSWIGNLVNWHLTPAEDVLPVENEPPLTMMERGNGDVVVGTATGLSVLRRSVWRRYAYDLAEGRFQGEEVGDALRAGPEVRALAEDTAGVLWVVAGDSIIRMPGPYDGLVQVWQLPPGRVTGLAALGQGALVAGTFGLRQFSRLGSVPLPAGLMPLAATPLRALAVTPSFGGPPVVLVAGETRVLAWTGEKLVPLWDGAADAVAWLPAESRLVLLHDGEVLTAGWNGQGDAAELPLPAAPPGEMRPLGRSLGLAEVEESGHAVLTVRCEAGLAFIRDGHAEIRPLAGPVFALATGPAGFHVAVPAGVWTVEKGVILK